MPWCRKNMLLHGVILLPDATSYDKFIETIQDVLKVHVAFNT